MVSILRPVANCLSYLIAILANSNTSCARYTGMLIGRMETYITSREFVAKHIASLYTYTSYFFGNFHSSSRLACYPDVWLTYLFFDDQIKIENQFVVSSKSSLNFILR